MNPVCSKPDLIRLSPAWLRLCPLSFLILILQAVQGGELQWESRDGWRLARLPKMDASAPGFSRMDQTRTGILFSNILSEPKALTNHSYLNGSGVALGDVDGDGLCDVYFCGLDLPNALYRNLGSWKFEDVTQASGVGASGIDATSAAFADLDGDKDLDLIVNSLAGGTLVLLNDGRGKFADVSKGSGLESRKARTSMALADVNGDGVLDVYISAYRTLPLMDMPYAQFEFRTVQGQRQIASVNGRPITDPEFANRFIINSRGAIDENGEGGDLYLGNGRGGFTNAPFTGGMFLDEAGQPLTQRPYDWELAAMFRDVNGDGAMDLYVCSDFLSPDRLWLNDGRGVFRASPILSIRKTSLFSMGVDFADINADGFDDFVLLDMLPRDLASRTSRLPDRSPLPPSAGDYATRLQTGRNTLFMSRQDGTYAEVANWAGVSASDWAWCPLFIDVDLDARPDLLVSNGNLRDNRNADVVGMLSRMRVEKKLSAAGVFESRKLAPPILVPNNAFRNRGDGSFEEVGATWGFSSKAISHGMACADLDNDGDLDVVVNTLNSIGEVYRNNASAGRILVRLKGLAPNTSAIGAMIRVSGGGLPPQQQEIQAGGRYLSSDDAARSFAASGPLMRVEVWWPGGRRSLVEPVPADCLLEIDQPGPGADPILASRPNKAPAADPSFEDVSRIVSFRHQDREFDDFARQPLQPWKLSQLGPGVSWWDANGDGFDDLIVASGKGGAAGILLNREGKQFLVSTQHQRILQAARDQTTLLPHPGTGTDPRLLVGLASFEDGLEVLPSVQSISLSQNRVYDAIPGAASSLGPLALADVDLDGDLDLFAGGRVVPGRYPSPASSRLFRFQEGRFVEDPMAGERLQTLGLVSDAVFSDLDGDGDPDLVLACEWGAVRVLLNDQPKWRDVTDAWGLGGFVGFWNGVTTGDFDGDGRLDIAASNWGMNTHYSAHTSTNHPVQIVWGEWSGTGMDVLETEWDADRGHYAPMRGLDVVSRSLPFVRDAASSHRAYASTSVEMLLGERFQAAQTSKASWLRSAVFLNRGDRFEVRSLGGSADWSPAYGICVGDFDGDGRQDLFLSQNFSGVPTDQVRLDSGCGVWMRGQGDGSFQEVPAHESGLRVWGDGRGAGAADYDGDGRLDIAVGQNGAEMKLFRNRKARPGIRVRLKGRAGNPEGIGAIVRARSAEGLGPAQEVRSGGGYWSRNSPVSIISGRTRITGVQVTWPGGRAVEQGIAEGVGSVEIKEP